MEKNTNDTKAQIPNQTLESKKAAVLGEKNITRLPLIAGAVIVALALIGGFLYFSGTGAKTASADTVTHAMNLFDDGAAKHFDYATEDGVTVRYFVLKSSDGVIRAAFDACDVCWRSGKGYQQHGDFMVCGNCGQRFASVLVNEVKGGCNPAPLNREIVDGKVSIRIADIVEGKRYFDFASRS